MNKLVQVDQMLPPDANPVNEEELGQEEGRESDEPKEDPVDLTDDQVDEEKDEKCGVGFDDDEGDGKES